jgi:hypothetical protein
VFEAGFVREGSEAYNPTAVRWWLMASGADGFYFARGGRVSNDQAAQSEIAGAHTVLERERAAWQNRRTHEMIGGDIVRRFTHELQPDGSLRPLTPTDFEIE